MTATIMDLDSPLQENNGNADDIFLALRQSNYQLVLELLEACPARWSERDKDGHTLMHWSALLGHEELIRHGLRHGCEVDARANNMQTPLMWAIVRGHVAIVRLLLEARADIYCQDSLGATPLIISVQHTEQNTYLVMLVIMQNLGSFDISSAVDENGCNATHWAAYKGDLAALSLLFDYKADLNRLDKFGMSPLHRAVYGGQPATISYLLENRANPRIRNNEGKDCFELASSSQLAQRLLRGEGQSQVDDDLEELQEPNEPASEARGCTDEKGIVESFITESSANWLLPYYNYAVNSFLEATGQESIRPRQDSLPLMSRPSRADYSGPTSYDVRVVSALPPQLVTMLDASKRRGPDGL